VDRVPDNCGNFGKSFFDYFHAKASKAGLLRVFLDEPVVKATVGVFGEDIYQFTDVASWPF
jgi:hypothetical protein